MLIDLRLFFYEVFFIFIYYYLFFSVPLWLKHSEQGCRFLGLRAPDPFFFARCCLGKVPGGASFSQLHKGDGNIDTSPMSDYHQSPSPMEVEETPKELAWQDFCGALSEGFLPLDDELRTSFDQTLHFEVGDPHATGGGLPRTYDKSNEDGGPN